MVFLPLFDDDPLASGKRAPMTLALIALTCLIFVWRQMVSTGEDMPFATLWGVVPSVVFGEQPFDIDRLHRYGPLISYMFLHAGWLHLFGNMLFLWIFGDNVEDATGRWRFLALYLLSGIAGALVYSMLSGARAEPLVGASGAVAGVMGAYLMIRPCATIRVLFLVVVLRVRAVWVILFWIALQIWNIAVPSDAGTAWWAHIGGAIAGALLIIVLKRADVKLFACMSGANTPAAPWGRRMRV